MPSTGIVAVAPFCSAMVVGVGSTVLVGLVVVTFDAQVTTGRTVKLFCWPLWFYQGRSI